MKAKKYFISTLSLIILFFSGIIGLNYYIDPFQVYHKHFFRPASFDDNQRFQNIGLINSYLDETYDSIILGTSTTMNLIPTEVAKIFNWKKTLKLSMDDSRPYEQQLLFENVFKKKNKIKHILWEIHADLWTKDHLFEIKNPSSFPMYLYNEDVVDDFNYFINKDTTNRSIKILKRLMKGKAGSDFTNLDKLNRWHEQAAAGDLYRKFSQKNHSEKIKPFKEFPKTEFKFLAYIKHIQPILKKYCNSDLKFNFYLSPFSRLEFATREMDELKRMVDFRKFFLKSNKNCKNVKLFGFDNNQEIVGNLAHYRDSTHYAPKVDKIIMMAMSAGSNELTLENIDEYNKKFLDHLKWFRNGFNDPIQKH